MSRDASLVGDELNQVALEAYLYFYPMVLMEHTRRNGTNVTRDAKSGRAPMGVINHVREYPALDFKAVVRPNFDTLYSSAWIDVSREPWLFHIPAMKDRFFMLPFYDMWTDVFASPGTRTHGEGALTLALCDPEWRGSLPEGVERIDAPTKTVWTIGRTETRGVDDYEAVRALQDQMWLRPLSSWLSDEFALDDTVIPAWKTKLPPMVQTDTMEAAEFFALASELVAVQPPHASDWGQVARLARAGFHVGHRFVLANQDDDVQAAFREAPAAARKAIGRRFGNLIPFVNGWSTILETMGTWGNSYLRRAMMAMFGLGANPPEESIYPNALNDSAGQPLDGHAHYSVHFAADALPPVRAFWSLTVYDQKGFPVPNEINRAALGDRDELVYNSDGSLTMYVGPSLRDEWPLENWIPTPPENFAMTLRLYLPEDSVLTGRWTPPTTTKLA